MSKESVAKIVWAFLGISGIVMMMTETAKTAATPIIFRI
jgi:hypothetical protein